MKKSSTSISRSIGKYLLTIIGSLILIGTWYFEKVSIQNHREKIDILRMKRLYYQMDIHYYLFKKFVSDLSQYNYSRDTTYALRYFISALGDELRAIEHLRDAAFHMKRTDEELAGDSETDNRNHQDYKKKINKINAIQFEGNLRQMEDLITNERKEVGVFTDRDQTEMNNQAWQEWERGNQKNTLFLIFYAIGIFLITVDKIKSTLSSDRKEEEFTNLLNHLKDQNDKIMRSKNNKSKNN